MHCPGYHRHGRHPEQQRQQQQKQRDVGVGSENFCSETIDLGNVLRVSATVKPTTRHQTAMNKQDTDTRMWSNDWIRWSDDGQVYGSTVKLFGPGPVTASQPALTLFPPPHCHSKLFYSIPQPGQVFLAFRDELFTYNYRSWLNFNQPPAGHRLSAPD